MECVPLPASGDGAGGAGAVERRRDGARFSGRLRNSSRQPGTPVLCRGGCLKLWRRSHLKDVLYKTLSAPSAPRKYGLEVPPPREVTTRYVESHVLEALERLHLEALERRSMLVTRPNPVRDAWIEMLLPFFTGDECCFFTGTYSDEYGYPHGLMKAANVLSDFRQALDRVDLEAVDWVVCAEPHQERDIWHCHALIADCDEAARDILAAFWSQTRGWASAAKLHDGGVMYATKYALKGSDAVLFDWRLGTTLPGATPPEPPPSLPEGLAVPA